MFSFRYAHSSVKLSDSTIVCIGGFGIDENYRHKRLDDVLLINFTIDECFIRRLPTIGKGPGK